MREKKLTRLLLAAALLLAAGPALSQSFPLDIELGYRFVNVAGNDGMYRSQINEREGFLLRSLTLATSDFNGGTKLFDKFRLDASDVGAGPLSAARLQMGESGVYDLRFSYARWHKEILDALNDDGRGFNRQFANQIVDGTYKPYTKPVEGVTDPERNKAYVEALKELMAAESAKE